MHKEKVVKCFGKDYCSCQSKRRCGKNHHVRKFGGLYGGEEKEGSAGGL